MELTLSPKSGIGKFRLFAKLSEVITEIQDGVDKLGPVDCIIEESSSSPIYLYLRSQGTGLVHSML